MYQSRNLSVKEIKKDPCTVASRWLLSYRMVIKKILADRRTEINQQSTPGLTGKTGLTKGPGDTPLGKSTTRRASRTRHCGISLVIFEKVPRGTASNFNVNRGQIENLRLGLRSEEGSHSRNGDGSFFTFKLVDHAGINSNHEWKWTKYCSDIVPWLSVGNKWYHK